jgi:hypothetical protein
LVRKPLEEFQRQADQPGQLLATRPDRILAVEIAEPQDRIGDGADRREPRIEAVGRS